MKDLLYIVLGLIAAGVAVWQMIGYMGKDPQTTQLVVAVIFTVIAMGFGVMFLLGKVNKEEDIHITK